MAATVTLGQLLLALDRTLVTLIDGPRGLDIPVRSVALIDADDVEFGLSAGARTADLFFLVGVGSTAMAGWISSLGAVKPAAIFAKTLSPTTIAAASAAGIAVVSVDRHARSERLYNLVRAVLESRPSAAVESEFSSTADLFTLAQSLADRVGALVSIEDVDSQVLAYSASAEEADELRRLSILGRAGPPEYLAWLRDWGIFAAVRAGADPVLVDERPELGLRARLAVGIHPHDHTRFLGTIWVQHASSPLHPDAATLAAGAASIAARIMAHSQLAPTMHDEHVARLLGLRGDVVDVAFLADQLRISANGPCALVGFSGSEGNSILLHASAFRPDAVVHSTADRAYAVFATASAPGALRSWAHGCLLPGARAVLAAPLDALTDLPRARAQVDRALQLPGPPVTDLVQSRSAIIVDELTKLMNVDVALRDSRLDDLRALDAKHGTELTASLRHYLDSFGDVRSAALALHIHPNTLRYRMRRVSELVDVDLTDPATRIVLSLGLRANHLGT